MSGRTMSTTMAREETTRLDPLDRTLLWTVALILFLLSIIMIVTLYTQWIRYDYAASIALKQTVPDHAAAITYERALDFAATKLCALLLSFVVTFVGALYVLRSSSQAFHLAVQGKGLGGTLQSTSPGLVMLTLGVVLAVVAILTHSELNYEPGTTGPAQITSEPATVTVQPSLRMEPVNKDAKQ